MAQQRLQLRRQARRHLPKQQRPPQLHQLQQLLVVAAADALVAAQAADPAGPLGGADQRLGAIHQLQGQHLKQLQGQQRHHGTAHRRPQRLDVDQPRLAEPLHHRHHPQPAPEGQQQGQVDPAAQQRIAPAQPRETAPQPHHPQQDVEGEDALEQQQVGAPEVVDGAAVFIDGAPIAGGHQRQHLLAPETPLLPPTVAAQPAVAEQAIGGGLGGLQAGPLPQAVFDRLQGAAVAGGGEGVFVDHRHRQLHLAAAQRGAAGGGLTRQQGGIEPLEGRQVLLGFAVGLDALHRVVEGGDVRQQRQRHHQRHLRQRREVALQPEGAQRQVGEVKQHPHQVEAGPQGHGTVPVQPEARGRDPLGRQPTRAHHRITQATALICLSSQR